MIVNIILHTLREGDNTSQTLEVFISLNVQMKVEHNSLLPIKINNFEIIYVRNNEGQLKCSKQRKVLSKANIFCPNNL